MRTKKEIRDEIKRVKDVRERMCALEPDVNSCKEGSALFIESCDGRIARLVTELRSVTRRKPEGKV